MKQAIKPAFPISVVTWAICAIGWAYLAIAGGGLWEWVLVALSLGAMASKLMGFVRRRQAFEN